MNSILLPVPRPADPVPEQRGGVAAEDLRRITERAELFAREQRAASEAAMTLSAAQSQFASTRAEEIVQARAVSARAATVRAHGTQNLCLGLGLSFIGTMAIGSIFSVGRR